MKAIGHTARIVKLTPRPAQAPNGKAIRNGKPLARPAPQLLKHPGRTPLGALATTQRPRERLLRDGAHTLRDAELIALVLRTGNGDKDAVELAQELLDRFGHIGGVLDQDSPALLAVHGLGSAKVAALIAIPEMLKRAELARISKEAEKKAALNTTTRVRRYVSTHLAGCNREVFGAVFLTSRNRPLVAEDIFFGSVDRASVYPREVVRRCLQHNAAAVILYHNHPSGVPDPSQTDKEITERLVSVLKEIDVKVVDHVVVASLRPVSMAELGML